MFDCFIVMGRVQISSGSGRLEDLAFGFGFIGFLISMKFFARVLGFGFIGFSGLKNRQKIHNFP